jgi:hypothetical protein
MKYGDVLTNIMSPSTVPAALVIGDIIDPAE